MATNRPNSTAEYSGSLDVIRKSPLDTRMLVFNGPNNLMEKNTWLNEENGVFIYPGMMVSVETSSSSNDFDIYVLKKEISEQDWGNTGKLNDYWKKWGTGTSGGGIEDAPSDDNLYGRKNGSWEQININPSDALIVNIYGWTPWQGTSSPDASISKSFDEIKNYDGSIIVSFAKETVFKHDHYCVVSKSLSTDGNQIILSGIMYGYTNSDETKEEVIAIKCILSKDSNAVSGSSILLENMSGSGIEEAPKDGKTYGRNNGEWTQITSSSTGGGIEEAPSDGKLYGRKDKSWSLVSTETGIEEAPLDEKSYVRNNGEWIEAGKQIITATVDNIDNYSGNLNGVTKTDINSIVNGDVGLIISDKNSTSANLIGIHKITSMGATTYHGTLITSSGISSLNVTTSIYSAVFTTSTSSEDVSAKIGKIYDIKNSEGNNIIPITKVCETTSDMPSVLGSGEYYLVPSENVYYKNNSSTTPIDIINGDIFLIIGAEHAVTGYNAGDLWAKLDDPSLTKLTGDSKIKIGRINKLFSTKPESLSVEGITEEDVYNTLNGNNILLLVANESMTTETIVVTGLTKNPTGGGKISGFFSLPTFMGAYKNYYINFNFDPDVKITVGEFESTSGSGITDAPSDGKLYGRKDSSWEEIIVTLESETI